MDATVQVQTYQGYEIFSLDPSNNAQVARNETAPSIVSISGGLGSALAGERAIQRYGRDNVALWFADTLEEDEDLYRFLHDLMKRWEGRLYYYTDGRTPPDVWQEHKFIPNSRIAPCTYELKVAPFRTFIKAMPQLPTVYIGYKPKETKRQCNTLASYAEAIPSAIVEYPLLWEPVETRSLPDVCRDEWGIEPPRAYALGFEYNNCLAGGGCCRNGIAAWVRNAYYFPTRFAKREQWEAWARSQGDSRANHSFCARQRNGHKEPLTLTQLKEEYLPQANKILKLEPEMSANGTTQGKTRRSHSVIEKK